MAAGAGAAVRCWVGISISLYLLMLIYGEDAGWGWVGGGWGPLQVAGVDWGWRDAGVVGRLPVITSFLREGES